MTGMPLQPEPRLLKLAPCAAPAPPAAACSEQVKVEEIHLSMTVMMNGTNGRLYYPNEKLRLIPFINITRSGNKVGGQGRWIVKGMLHYWCGLIRCLHQLARASASSSAWEMCVLCLLTDPPLPSPSLFSPTLCALQGESFKVMVDMNTPGISGVMEVLRAAGDAVIRASPTEFSSVMAVNLREGGTPLKMTISVRRGSGGGQAAVCGPSSREFLRRDG